MEPQTRTGGNRRVAGALLLGVALVAGAIVLKNFSTSSHQAAFGNDGGVVAIAPAKQYIPTRDSDGDGLRDWEEALVQDQGEITIDTESTYTPPETLTDQFAVSFFEDMVRSGQYGAFGQSDEELVQSAASSLAQEATDELFTRTDLTITPTTQENEVRRYFNLIAQIITQNNAVIENSAVILDRALRAQDPELLEPLRVNALVYQNMRDAMLAVPVPIQYVPEHIALLNAYHAIATDIEAMQQAFVDPLLTMVRMKRYEDDAAGLFFALQNMYFALEASPYLFTEADPAFLLVAFKPSA